MTDFQFRAVIKMVIEILRGCKTLEEAITKLYGLINEAQQVKDYAKDTGSTVSQIVVTALESTYGLDLSKMK